MQKTRIITRWAAGAALVVLPFALARGEPAPREAAGSPTAAPAATHVLFMGANLAVEHERRYLDILDVEGRNLLVTTGEQTLEVRMDAKMVMQVTDALKLADTSVAVDGLKAERAYTPEADPFLKFAEAVSVSSALADRKDENDAALNRAIASQGFAQAAVDGSTPETRAQAERTLQSAQQTVAEAQAAVATTETFMRSDLFDVGAQSSRMASEAGQELFDAIRISFELVPARDLTRPFCAVIAWVRERDSRPGAIRKWIYLRPLEPIARGDARKVVIYRGGFPPGYLLERCDVHVFDQGSEVATNLSRKRVELSADDVQQYRIVEYIGANRGRTLPAALLSDVGPGGAGARLTPAQREPTYHLVVNKAGKVVAACLDDSGKELVRDPAVDAMLKALRFYPALRDGKPVETVIPFRIDRID